MAVYAPGDDPTAGQGQDPGMWARLMGFVGGMNPIGSAQAGEAPPQGPGPVDPDAAARRAAIERLRPQMANPGNTNTPAIMPHMFGDGPNVQGRPVLPYIDPRTAQIANAANIPTGLPPQGAPPSRGGIGSDANLPILGGGTGMPSSYGAPGQVPAPLAPMAPPIGSPAPAVPPPRPVAQPVRKPVRIPASATASVPPAGSPFVPIAAQNQDWSGGALSRYGTKGLGRQGTALDLSKLFSRQ